MVLGKIDLKKAAVKTLLNIVLHIKQLTIQTLMVL